MPKKRLNIGGNNSIRLDSINEYGVEIFFLEQSYGLFNVDDQVVIDDDRNFEVNGEPRVLDASSSVLESGGCN